LCRQRWPGVVVDALRARRWNEERARGDRAEPWIPWRADADLQVDWVMARPKLVPWTIGRPLSPEAAPRHYAERS